MQRNDIKYSAYDKRGNRNGYHGIKIIPGEVDGNRTLRSHICGEEELRHGQDGKDNLEQAGKACIAQDCADNLMLAEVLSQ